MNLITSKFIKLSLSYIFLTRKIALYFILFFIIGNPFFLFSQYDSNFIGRGVPSLRSLEKKATAAFDCGDYYTAYVFYEKAVKIDDTKLSNLFSLAEAARKSRAFGLARDVYERLFELDTINEFPFVKMHLAEMELNKGNYLTADNLLLELAADSSILGNLELNKLLEKNIRNIEFALSDPQSGNDNLPVKLSINTKWAEISPIWRNGNLYYSALAFPKQEDSIDPPRKYSKVLSTNLMTGSTAVEWEKINIPDTSVAHVTFTPDSNRIYFTICEYPKCGNKIIKASLDCQLYYRDKVPGTHDEWEQPIKLPANVNHPEFTSTHPAYGEINLNEPVLYFSTNRNAALDKKGDMDIWYTKILPNNKFSNPVNLGAPVNTEYNEITPFYHFPSKTLFFSSDGHESLGGYDIHKVKLTDTIRSIENLQQPYNSSSDDRYYSLTDEEGRSFFVTNRFSCNLENMDSVGCDDIYVLEEPCITKVEAFVYDEEKELIPIISNNVKVRVGNRGMKYDSIQHNFRLMDILSSSYSESYLADSIMLYADAVGYIPDNLKVNIEQCKNNEFEIYLCKATVNISLYKKEYNKDTKSYNDSKELQNGTVIINDSIRKYINGNSYRFEYQINESYTFTAEDDTLRSREVFFSSDKCLDSIRILLEYPIVPDSIPDTIACYFAHDIPAQATTILPFDEYYRGYSNDRIKGTYRNIFLDNVALVDTFFEKKVDKNFRMLEKFKNYLTTELEKTDPDSTFTITLRGYTSTVGNEDYNKELAERRIEAVEKYFSAFYKDEFGKLDFEHEPLGEEGIGNDDPKDKRNSVYHPSSAEKRRVEIIVRKRE